MEGKLIKMVEGYTLSLTGSIDDLYGISDKQLARDHQLQKLSLKNCESIENGYDLEELVKERFGETFWHDGDKHFKEGFQKALEISANKKFTENQVRMAIEIAWRNDIENTKIDIIESIIKSEWDVEIEMECPQCKEWGYISECRNNCNQKFLQPKLDADGCLILKRRKWKVN